MDGKIVADFITAGMLRISGASTQTSDKASGKNKTLFLKVYSGNNEIGHWGSDGIWVGTGSIDLGKKTSQTINGKTGNFGVFHVDDDGFLSLKKGSIQLGTADSNNRFPFFVNDLGQFQFTTWSDANKTKMTARWTSAGIWMEYGEIKLGTPSGTSPNIRYPFFVNESGILQATGADISGTISASAGYIGLWKIHDGLMDITNGASAILSKNKIGCGRAGYGISILRGDTAGCSHSTNTSQLDGDSYINFGGDSNWTTDRAYGYIQISNSGQPNECRGGLRIFGNGHIVKYDDNGNKSDERWISEIPEELDWIVRNINAMKQAMRDHGWSI